MDIGDVLADRYELRELLGRGGMGRVFRGYDRTLERDVAIKVLARELVGDERAVARIISEARLAARVQHPNVVTVYDAALDGADEPAIVLELVDGPTLTALVQPGGMPDIDAALDLIAGVAAGLQAAHDVQLVHRDVSTANVLLDGGVPRLTDFGIARSSVMSGTMTATVRGSVSYLAPEQATGQEVGPLADVYALACVATTLLTGSPPFAAEEPLGIVDQHLRAEPPDLRARRPDLPQQIADAVVAALAKDPAARPQSALEFAASIGRPIVVSPSIGVPEERARRVVEEVSQPPVPGSGSIEVRGLTDHDPLDAGDEGFVSGHPDAETVVLDGPHGPNLGADASWDGSGDHADVDQDLGAPSVSGPADEPWISRPVVLVSAGLLAVVALIVGTTANPGFSDPDARPADGLAAPGDVELVDETVSPLPVLSEAPPAEAPTTGQDGDTQLPEAAATDAVTRVRERLIQLYTADALTADGLEKLDEVLVEAVAEIRAPNVDKAAKQLVRFREELRELTSDGQIVADDEAGLLLLALEVEEALTEMAAAARSDG